jgi:CHASE3 domain sensor protein
MDSQFNTLIRSYHDNFLQYRLTGNPSYKQAYEGAQQGLDNIVSSLEQQNTEQKKNISSFYSEDVEGRLRDLRSQTRDTERKVVSENDQVIAAEMRTQSVSVGGGHSNTIYYILGGVALLGIGFIAFRK